MVRQKGEELFLHLDVLVLFDSVDTNSMAFKFLLTVEFILAQVTSNLLGNFPSHCTLMRFFYLEETSTDIAADWIFEKFRLT